MENNTNEINNEDENNNVKIFDENNITEKGNLFLPIQVENYLNVILYYIIIKIQSNSDWGNTNEILLKVIKSLTNTVHYQGMALKQMDKELREKFSFNELNPLLNNKLDNSDLEQIINNINIELEKRPTNEEIIEILNQKVDKKELAYALESKPSTNDLYNNRKKIEENSRNIELIKDNIHNIILNNTQQKNEMDLIKKELNKKSNLDDVAEALELKLDNENFVNELNNIKNNIENDINIIKKEKLEEIEKKIEEINRNKNDVNDFKLISDAFQDMKLNLTQRIDDIDNDFDRLIENIKTQFNNTNKLITDLENKKSEKNDFDNMNLLLSKKLDEDKFNKLISDLKNNIFESMNNFKEDYLTNIKILENKSENKNDTIITELNKQNESIQNFINNEKQEISLIINEILNENNLEYNNNIEELNEEIKKLNINLNEKINKKLDEEKFDSYLNNIKKELNSKMSLFDSQKNIQEISSSLDKKLNILITNMKQEIITNLESLLNEKADISLLNDKISSVDFNVLKDYINTVDFELKQKMETLFNEYMNIIQTNMQEINLLLNNKVNIDEYNSTINKIRKDLKIKIDNNEFNNAMNNQALINDIICNENQIGRWLWKTGKIKSGFIITWDTQKINTAPDNYLWEKDKSVINIINGGIYQINLGFYFSYSINKKPQVQIIINNENVINVNNNNYHLNNKINNKKMNSISFSDFIILKDNSKISVTFNGEEGLGFIGLKKL